jgi:signal transduction histidine kinase
MASDPPGRARDAARPATGAQLVRDRKQRSGTLPHGARTHSIRLRLLLPVLVATVGLVALGVQQSLAAVSLADQGGKAETVAATAVAAVRLEYQLEREIAESDALRQRGDTAGDSLATARRQTDLAAGEFLAVSGAGARLGPVMRPLLEAAGKQLDALARTRADVDSLKANELAASRYAPLTDTLIAIADALPQQISDAVLSAKARALVALMVEEHIGAQQRDLLRGVFVRGSYSGSELAQAALLAGEQQARTSEFERNASAAQRSRHQAVWAGADGADAARILTNALASPAQVEIDPDIWYIEQSNALRQLAELQSDLSRDLDRAARGQQSIAQTKALVTAVSTVGLMLLALGTALMLAVRTSRRLRRLRTSALGVAQVELPDAIASLSAAPDAAAVRNAVSLAHSRVGEISVRGADEITEVGLALAQVHRQALRLAADQAALRIDVAALFVALSRRGQTLIQRQLQLIDDFERVETDPHRLERLFAVDHLAARMRRNEENLLVLAGGEPGRRISEVVPLVDLVRAAAAEIEDYDRIDPTGIADVGITAVTARDLIHLLAELLENATSFSPPSSRVRVTARREVEGVLISVYDEGIGMPAAQLDEINIRLASAAQLTAELAGTMGLLVVSRLADRHSIAVRLKSAHRGGTVAIVRVPNGALAPAPTVTEHTAAMLRRTVAPVGVAEGEALVATPEVPPYVPRAAVSGVPAPTVVPPAPRVPGAPPVSGSPEGAGAGAARTPESGTGAGGDLPQRRPGGLLPPGTATGAADLDAGGAGQPAAPDPELIRARLSGLASGFAAAARQTQTDPPPTPRSNGAR